ncbi:MAG: glycerol-3-phosphate 1-O-acyltransferase PlsY [Alphaproteobacteria bacterium]|nr:glycerol-3-phosphate 1-O-acyltransferase PlsY [Alphaproteobacteria bacterium]MBL0717963.1 glycerol-3-phosphate 1-O-acyltransferase PlsY [Alphaproteobacteria bacterium]
MVMLSTAISFDVWVIIFSVLSFIIGSIPFGRVFTKVFYNINIYEVGSKNSGTTNVIRSTSLWLGVLTLFFDIFKVCGIVLLLKLFTYDTVSIPLWHQAFVGTVGIFGHCFSIFHKFHGGKGVASTVGLLLVIVPKLFLAILPIWLLFIVSSRYMSLANIVSSIAIIIGSFFFLPHSIPSIQPLIILISLLVIYRHKDNIKRLISKTESKLF